MASCPYENHRLVLTDSGRCARCGGELNAYACLRDLSFEFYNEARLRWDRKELHSAEAWLQAALRLRDNFKEAWWLLGALQAKTGRADAARRSLERARDLGAELNFDLITTALDQADGFIG
jgi:tetratricopeptide (TPR) repeat protein